MKSLTLLLIPLLFLTSCTIDWNDEKDKKITELEKQIQDDTFRKKQECSSDASKYMQIVKDKNEGLHDFKYTFIEKFYSPVKNECLWILKEDYSGINSMKTMYFLIPSGNSDFKGNIDRCSWNTNFTDGANDKDYNDCDKFDERVQKLKFYKYE